MTTLPRPTLPLPADRAACAEAPVRLIRPRRGLAALDLANLWRSRELAWTLAFRDLRVRYKQTALGAAWAIIQPLATMVVLTIFFGNMLGVASEVGDAPYPVFLYAGLLVWTLFTAAVTASATSLVNNAQILTKVYFPRLLLPIGATLPPVVDYFLAAGVLLGLMLYFDVAFAWQLMLLPLVVLSTLLATLGVGVTLAAITVSYRDVRHALPFGLQLMFFMTPVIYPVSMLPEQLGWMVTLNPMAGPIDAARAAVLGHAVDWTGWLASTGVSAGLLVVGLVWFSRVESRFADLV